MKDPQRLLIGDGTPLERELLRSVLGEPVPPALHARMLAALPLFGGGLEPGFDPTTAGSAGSGGSSTGGAAAGNLGSIGKVGLTKVASGGALKTLLVSLGVGSALTVGWMVARPASTPSNGSQATDATNAALVAPVERPSAPTPAELPLVEETANVVEPVAQTTPGLVPVVRKPIGQPQASNPVYRSSKPQVSTSSNLAVTQASAVAQNPNEATPQNPTLVAELKLLDAARAAIQRGDREQSLQVLDTYARRFPQGELAHEAGVLRGLAQHDRE